MGRMEEENRRLHIDYRKKKKWGTNLIKKGLNEDKQDKVRRKKSEKQKGEIRECEL